MMQKMLSQLLSMLCFQSYAVCACFWDRAVLPKLILSGTLLLPYWALGATQISLSSERAQLGHESFHSLEIMSDQALAGFQIDLNYDSQRLLPTMLVPGNQLGTHTVHSSEPAPGVLRIVIYSPEAVPMIGGVVAQIALKPVGNVEGTLPLHLREAIVADMDGRAIQLISIKDGSVVFADNTAPLARPDWFSINEDAAIDIPSNLGVLANDSDPEAQLLKARVVSLPQHGSLEFNDDGSFRYVPFPNYQGMDSFAYVATDGQLSSDPTTTVIEIKSVNDAPQIVLEQPILEVNEGSMVFNSGDWFDADDDSVTIEASEGDIRIEGRRWLWSLLAKDGPNPLKAVTITIRDNSGGASAATFNLNVKNVVPEVFIQSPPTELQKKINDEVPLRAIITDPGTEDTHTAQWMLNRIGDDEWIVPGNVTGNTVGDSVRFTKPGVYLVKLVVLDKDGGRREVHLDELGLPRYVVIYNPQGEFVTGSGAIAVPTDAVSQGIRLDTRPGEIMHFNILAKYRKDGASPEGRVELRLQSGGFEFQSTSLRWMVASGGQAIIKGYGTINGASSYPFIIRVDVGERSPFQAERFRVQIYDSISSIIKVFNNQPGAAEWDDLVSEGTLLKAGSINIHKN